MAEKSILEGLFDEKILKVLKLFILNPEDEFYVREVAKRTRVPLATSFRILQKLVILNLLREIKIKHYKAYRLEENKDTQFLESILTTARSAIDEFVEQCSKLRNVQEIIQHGKETKDRVSLLIIGKNLDTEAIKQIVGSIKDKFNFSIMQLPVEPEQFNQMSQMGLYPQKKVTLYPK